MSDFQTTIPVSHVCQCCSESIAPGTPAICVTGKMEAYMFRVYFHSECWGEVTGQEPPWGCSCAAHDEEDEDDGLEDVP